jgi:hypothetical protein
MTDWDRVEKRQSARQSRNQQPGETEDEWVERLTKAMKPKITCSRCYQEYREQNEDWDSFLKIFPVCSKCANPDHGTPPRYQ